MTPRNRIEGLAGLAVRTLAPLLGAIVLLGGCASTLTSEVTSFHRLEDGLSGERFVVVPSESQAGSLEFETYAGFVREALVGHGLLDGGIGNRADALRVGMAYSVDSGASVVGPGTRGEVGIGVGAGSGGFSMGGIGIGFGIPIGGTREAAATWRRSLTVTIDRPRATGAERVFEATAVSRGQSAAVTPVMQAMVQAIFRDFPGRNGVTRIVEVPLPAP